MQSTLSLFAQLHAKGWPRDGFLTRENLGVIYPSWSMTGSDTHFAEYRHRAVDLFGQPSPLLFATKYNMVLLQTKELTLCRISDHKQ